MATVTVRGNNPIYTLFTLKGPYNPSKGLQGPCSLGAHTSNLRFKRLGSFAPYGEGWMLAWRLQTTDEMWRCVQKSKGLRDPKPYIDLWGKNDAVKGFWRPAGLGARAYVGRVSWNTPQLLERRTLKWQARRT